MKNKTTAGIFALVFGGLGVHRFYLGQTGRGLLYLLFIWTFIPTIVAMIDGIVFLTQDEDTFNRKYNPQLYGERQQVQQQREVVYVNPAPASAPSASAPAAPPVDPFRSAADAKYAAYDFEGAIRDYRRSLNVDPRQAGVHFKLACLYSIHEQTREALSHLSQALENGYYDFDEIERHDHLAYLRSTPEYEAFKQNGYRPAPVTARREEPTETLELSDDLITRIERLAKLKEEGILTDESFEREKAKVLRG
jgi:TM2 domain-containing membrane protein YozV